MWEYLGNCCYNRHLITWLNEYPIASLDDSERWSWTTAILFFVVEDDGCSPSTFFGQEVHMICLNIKVGLKCLFCHKRWWSLLSWKRVTLFKTVYTQTHIMIHDSNDHHDDDDHYDDDCVWLLLFIICFPFPFISFMDHHRRKRQMLTLSLLFLVSLLMITMCLSWLSKFMRSKKRKKCARVSRSFSHFFFRFSLMNGKRK